MFVQVTPLFSVMFVMSGCSVIWPGLVWCGIVDATAGDDSTGADDIDGTVDGAGACDGYDQATVGDVTVPYHLV